MTVDLRPYASGARNGHEVARHGFFRQMAALPLVDRIVLFGSRARGDHDSRSDIDLAVFCDSASDDDWQEVLACLQEDRIDTSPNVDRVRLDEVDAALRANILTEGVVLYERRGGT